jgi:hypothetical protein
MCSLTCYIMWGSPSIYIIVLHNTRYALTIKSFLMYNFIINQKHYTRKPLILKTKIIFKVIHIICSILFLNNNTYFKPKLRGLRCN